MIIIKYNASTTRYYRA